MINQPVRQNRSAGYFTFLKADIEQTSRRRYLPSLLRCHERGAMGTSTGTEAMSRDSGALGSALYAGAAGVEIYLGRGGQKIGYYAVWRYTSPLPAWGCFSLDR